MENVVPTALLRECLTLSDDTEALRQLRLTLLSKPNAWEGLCKVAAETRLAPAVRARLIERGLMPPAHVSKHAEMQTPASVFESFEQQHTALRSAEEHLLGEIVDSLNRAGIEPLLIKGARVLWLNKLPWRTMRDLDLIIPRGQETKAMHALGDIGLVPWEDARDSPGHHHLSPLYRPGLNFLVELHRKAANRYAEPFFATSEIWKRSELHERDGMVVHMLPEAEEIWHNLIHNHIGHSGYARGLIDIKGLYEFAVAYGGLDAGGRNQLSELAGRSSMGLAALDLWVVAARNGLGMTSQQGDRLATDAMDAWNDIRARADGVAVPKGKYPGYSETLRMALNTERVHKVAANTGRWPIAVRMSAIRALLPRVKKVT